MAQRQQQEKVRKDTVQTLNNDFVRSNEAEIIRRQRQKKRKGIERRRMAVMLAFIGIFCICFTITLVNQNQRLTEKKKQLVLAEEHLEEVQGQQEMLKLQLAKLEDDEYIAKLARKEYFLSEEGEIIFTIPTEQAKDDQENVK